MTAAELATAVNSVARAWQTAGRAAPVASSPGTSARCEMPECAGMAFVVLKTSSGPASLCLTHFESVKADPGA
jgi:hypothetical protein